jgi:uridine kinase
VLTKAFPRITIVTSGVDPELNKSKLWIEPGMGNFGGKEKNYKIIKYKI